MFSYFRGKAAVARARFQDEADEPPAACPLLPDLTRTMIHLRAKYENSSDFLTRELTLGGVRVEFVLIEGMVGLQTMSELLAEPLVNRDWPAGTTPQAILDFIETRALLAVDQKDVFTDEEVFRFIMSGFVVVLIDGVARGVAMGLQGFGYRSISEPSSEMTERGSREGFTEPLRINMTMVRRRVKAPQLKFDLFTVGSLSKTDVCLIYLTNRASPELVREVRRRISKIKLDVVLAAGYLKPFLEGNPWSLFTDVGTTERPDVLAAKVNEGRVAVLVDGTPFALIVPYLFIENFQSLDDYAHRSYFASFIRILRYIAFAAALFLPALYVAVGAFHPELLPAALLFNVAAAEEVTPFPLMMEALLIHLLFEIMREAGLRLPRPIGQVIGIVGAIVIGEAAVTAGLIGSPMVLIVAMTAIASFVVPSLYEPVSVLRLALIVAGGVMGLYGVALGGMLVLVNACSLQNFGSPYTAPIAPFSRSAMRDTFFRASFKTLQKKTAKIQDLEGSDMKNRE